MLCKYVCTWVYGLYGVFGMGAIQVGLLAGGGYFDRVFKHLYVLN